MIDFHKARSSFESIGRQLKCRNIRPQEDEGNFIKKVTESCRDTGACYYVCNRDVIAAVMQSQRGCIDMDDFAKVALVLFTSCSRKLIKDNDDIEKVVKILSKVKDEDKLCCVCQEVSPGLVLHCQSCTTPICKSCFVGMALANGKKSYEDDDEDYEDFHEPSHVLACPACRAQADTYNWATEACLPVTTKTFPNYNAAIKSILKKKDKPFTLGTAFMSCFSDDIDKETHLTDDTVGTKTLGTIWMSGNTAICTPDGSNENCLESLDEDCDALVLGNIPKCVHCVDHYMQPGAVFIKLGDIIHDVSEAFPLYAAYLSLKSYHAAQAKKEQEEENIFSRIHQSLDSARMRWEASRNKELDDFARASEQRFSEYKEQAEQTLNRERTRFLEILMDLKNKEPVGYFECRKLELILKLKQSEFDKMNILNSSPELRILEFERLKLLNDADN